MNNKPKTYKRITKTVIAKHKAAMLDEGNSTAAVRATDEDYISPKDRAYRITKKSEEMNTVDYIDSAFQQIGIRAVERVNEMVLSPDERIATKNSHYVIDHLRGKAVQRTESKHLSLNIQTVLE